MEETKETTVQEVKNFSRFYAALNRIPALMDKEEMKRELVGQYTDRRTYSLKAMTRKEYAALCDAVEAMSDYRDELRRGRSRVLHLMQSLGVNTSDWARVDDFTLNPRIGGKRFSRLRLDELEALSVRLRALKSKGWRSRDGMDDKRVEPVVLVRVCDNGCDA